MLHVSDRPNYSRVEMLLELHNSVPILNTFSNLSVQSVIVSCANTSLLTSIQCLACHHHASFPSSVVKYLRSKYIHRVQSLIDITERDTISSVGGTFTLSRANWQIAFFMPQKVWYYRHTMDVKGTSSLLQAKMLKLCGSAIIYKKMIIKNFSGSEKVRNWLLV